MTNIDELRETTEDDAAQALADIGAVLPIRDEETLAIVIARLFAGPATVIEIQTALYGAYVELPVTTLAALVEAFNRYLDLKLGEGAGTDD